jgi:WD40 repeat protein
MTLVEVLQTDQHARWARGERPTVEDYLQQHPHLRDNAEAVCALLHHEYLLRQHAGEQPDLDAFAGRFPALADMLRGVLRLEELLLSQPTPAVPASAAAVTGPYLPAAMVSPATTGAGPSTMRPAAAGPARAESGGVPMAVAGYAVLGVLGRGGMGVVYKAEQTALRRLVALKMILHAEYAGEEERQRFQAEAEAVARLQHPNIVQVYEVGEHGGLPYFSLEYCSGGSLAQQLDGTPWQPKRAAALVQTLAQAMEAAHQAGLVHRDLKPGNVLLTADGIPKVTDFGLVKRLDVAGQTQSGAVVGTPSYMAPEQAGGKQGAIGPAADVYALGAILYELLTGRPPFKAASVMETLHQVLHAEPLPVRRLQLAVPRDLETICLKCLEKDPGKRYASAATLAEDLRRFGAGEPVQARPVGLLGRLEKWARRRPAVAALLLVVAVLALVGGTGILWALGEAVHERNVAEGETEKAQQAAMRAGKKEAEARQEAEEAKKARDQARWQTYVAEVGRAEARFYAGEVVGARDALDGIPPEQRGWEHRWLQRRSEGTPRSLLGHTAAVTCVAYSPDGSRIASASADQTVKVWDAMSGSEIATFRGHTDMVRSVAYSPNGSRIASASRDHTVKLWDVSSGTEIATLKGHTNWVSSVAYSHDGSRIASASSDKTVKVWDAKSGTEVATLKGHIDGVLSVAYSPDSSRIASASYDHTVKVWDARRGTEIATLKGHTEGVICVAYSPDGSRIASASWDNTVKVWDARSGTEVANLRVTSVVDSVAYSPDGSRIAGASRDQTVKVWDARSGTEIATLRQTSAVGSVVYSPDGSRIASALGDGTVKLWDVSSGTEIATLKGHTNWVSSVAYSHDGSRIASASSDKTVKVWDAKSGTEVATLKGHTDAVGSVAYSPDSSRIASASSDKTVKVWDARSGTEVATLKGHTNWVSSVAYSPDGSRIASASSDKTVKVWDTKSGTEVATLKGHTVGPKCVAYSPDGSRIVSSSGAPLTPGGEVKVWDARSGTEIATLHQTSGVWSVAYSPDGSRIASALGDGRVKVWDANSGTEIATLKGHTDAVGSVAYSPDGSRIASASSDKTVKVWDARSGTEVATLKGHTVGVTCVAYSPDGSRIASASYDGRVNVWDARSSTEIATLKGHTGTVRSVAYSPDGSRIAGASWDNTVKVWDANSGTEIATLRQTSAVASVVYSPDGSRIASALDNGTVKVWDTKSGTEVATLKGHTCAVRSVAYSPDGSRIVSSDARGKTLVWDAAAARLLANERPPNTLQPSSVSPDGQHIAIPDREVIRIHRRHPVAGAYDPWLEDAERRRVQVPLWHVAEFVAAFKRGDAFAAAFHRQRLLEGDNIRLLAWAQLAAGDRPACVQNIAFLRAEEHGVAAQWRVSATLASALAVHPVLGSRLGPAAVAVAARQEARRRAAVLVRAAALLPDSGINSAEVVMLARACVAGDPQSGPCRELLGAALYRDGKPAEAIKELDEAVKLHGDGGSL